MRYAEYSDATPRIAHVFMKKPPPPPPPPGFCPAPVLRLLRPTAADLLSRRCIIVAICCAEPALELGEKIKGMRDRRIIKTIRIGTAYV
jgi:hypothetical protein